MDERLETAYLTDGEKEELEIERTTYHFDTQIEFLKAHCGYRPGLMHVLLGPTSGGKSTLVKTMLFDLVIHLGKRKALLILSEERVKDFYISMTKMPSTLKWGNLRVTTEDKIYEGSDVEVYLQSISEIVEKENISIVFYDNLTTSKFYPIEKLGEQERFVKSLKSKLCHVYDIPFVIVAHTRAEITVNHNKITGPEDIRGCKTTANLAECLYTLQVIDVEKHRFQYVKGHKGRGYDYDPGFFFLGYNSKIRCFDRIEKRDFESFRLNFEDRQRLDGKRKK
jgi:energy-coupling factor transporter ATP-binding protein EcfA2